MDNIADFARDILAVLRPHLTPAERDDVDFYCEDHSWRTAVVAAVAAAAGRRATAPALVLKLLQVRAEDGTFTRRNTTFLLRALPRLRAADQP